MLSERKTQRTFTPQEEIALKKLQERYALELKKCQTITDSTKLTSAEYKKSGPLFKALIDSMWKQGKPVFIMPEFIDDDEKDDKLHPELEKFVGAIKKGTPYHEFIPDTYGEAWPVLLRLFYGLTSGFRINIEQMHSMLNICYWRELGTVRMEPFYNISGNVVTPSKIAHLVALHVLSFPDDDTRQRFANAVLDYPMAEGERAIQVITLNKDYIHAAIWIYEQYLAQNPNCIILRDEFLRHDKKYHHASYDAQATAKRMGENGALMLRALLTSSTSPHYRPHSVDEGASYCIFLPSQSLLQIYERILQPERKGTVERITGPLTALEAEQYTMHDKRPFVLPAPGALHDDYVHGKVISPPFAEAHDGHHRLTDAYINQTIYQQLVRIIICIRRVFTDRQKVTAEIMRCVDREKILLKKDPRKDFISLLEGVFWERFSKDIAMSSALILVDMILSPEHWPYYQDAFKKDIISLLLFRKEPADIHVGDIESHVKKYAAQTKNDIALTAILMLCHYFLKDATFGNVLTNFRKEHAEIDIVAWRKRDHGHLYPVVVVNGKDYTFEALATLTTGQRTQLIWAAGHLAAKKIAPKASGESKTELPNTFIISSVIAEKKAEWIKSLGGKTTPAGAATATLCIDYTKLDKEVRPELGLCRKELVFVKDKEEEIDNKLKELGVTVVKKGDAFHVTLRASEFENLNKLAKAQGWVKEKTTGAAVETTSMMRVGRSG